MYVHIHHFQFAAGEFFQIPVFQFYQICLLYTSLYTWQLEGFYDGWTTPSDEGTIRFTNVAPGTYTPVSYTHRTDMVLCEEYNVILSPKQFPELLDHKGEDLIVTNGKTLWGADDKAGIAEIISAMVYLKEHPEIKHGKIRV